MRDKRNDIRYNPINCNCNLKLRKQIGYVERYDQQRNQWRPMYPNYRTYFGTNNETVTLLAADNEIATFALGCTLEIDGYQYAGLQEAYDAIQALVLEVQKEIANFREGGGVGDLGFNDPIFFESTPAGVSIPTGFKLDLSKDGLWYVESRAMALEPSGLLAFTGTSSLVARTVGDGVTYPVSSVNVPIDPPNANLIGVSQNFLQPLLGISEVMYRVQPGGPNLKWKLFVKFEFFKND